MSSRAFVLFYVLCLCFCAACVQGARAVAERSALNRPDRAPTAVVTATVAVPPKPVGELDRRPPRTGQGNGSAEPRYDEATCARYEGDFRDVCHHALARQRAPRDLEGALQACALVERPRLAQECQADAAELYARSDLAAARAVCPGIPTRKWRDQCVFGIAMALVESDPRLALATCEEAGIWRDFCRHDTLGETSVRDLDLVLELCGREEGDLLTRKTCWHGIGKYIGRQDLDRAFAACRRVPEGPEGLYRENCMHGAGWAAGERQGAAGAERCPEAGPQEDSCRLGVAFQIRSGDPDAAVGLCQSVRRADLRQHCLGWVGGS